MEDVSSTEGNQLDIQYLREYVVFAKYLNFSTAAKNLFIAQPTLSQHISLLEEEVGVSLIDREPTPTLTIAGAHLFDKAQDMIALHDTAIEDCKKITENTVFLRVPDVLHTFPIGQYLNRAIYELEKSGSPKRHIIRRVSYGNNTSCELLDKKIVDLGFIFTPHDDEDTKKQLSKEGFQSFRLFAEPQYVFVHESNMLYSLDTLEPSDLEGYSFLTNSQPIYDSYRESVEKFFKTRNVNAYGKMSYNTSPLDSPFQDDYNDVTIAGEHFAENLNLDWRVNGTEAKQFSHDQILIDIVLVYKESNLSPDQQHYIEVLKNTVTEQA